MQAYGAAQGVGTVPRRGGRPGVLAIAATVVIVVAMALLVRETPPATSGVGADAPKAGVVSTVVHNDAGNMPRVAGPAVVHDDAGNVKPY